MGVITKEGRVEAALGFKNYNYPSGTPAYWMAIGRTTPWGECNISGATTISATQSASEDDYFTDSNADSEFGNLKVGDAFTISGFSNGANNNTFVISAIVISTNVKVSVVSYPGGTPVTLVTEPATNPITVTGISSETNPPAEDPDATSLDEVIGFFAVATVTLAYESLTGSIVFRTQTFDQLLNDAAAHANNAHFVYLTDNIPYADELPIIDYRQIGLYKNVVAAPAYTGRAWLIPYGLAKGSVQQPFNIITASNDQIMMDIDGGGTPFTFNLTAGLKSAADVVSEINTAINTASGGIYADTAYAYEGDGVVFIRSASTAHNSAIEIVGTSNDAYSTLGLTVGTYENEVQDNGFLIYMTNEQAHSRHLDTRDTIELIAEF